LEHRLQGLGFIIRDIQLETVISHIPQIRLGKLFRPEHGAYQVHPLGGINVAFVGVIIVAELNIRVYRIPFGSAAGTYPEEIA
jgi:hypothetical protein